MTKPGTSRLYSNGNRLSRKFNKCTKEVKLLLFRTYCSSFYGIHLWSNFTKKSIQAMKVAYNSSYRSFMALKRDCSISGNQVRNNVTTFDAWRRRHVYSIMMRVEKSCNSVVRCFGNTLYHYYVSPLVQMWWNLLHLS